MLGGQWSVTVGAHGSVLSASGRLAAPAAVGDYPLAGVAAGVHRLEQGGKWIIYSGPVPMLGAPLRGPAAATTSVPPQTAGAPGSSAVSAPGGGPAVPPTASPCPPGEPCPAVSPTMPASAAPILVTITGVHLAMAWAWPLDPSSHDAWLVPVYVFQLAGQAAYPWPGNQVPVLAVASQYAAAPPPAGIPAGATKPGTAPAPDTAVTAPAPSAASST